VRLNERVCYDKSTSLYTKNGNSNIVWSQKFSLHIPITAPQRTSFSSTISKSQAHIDFKFCFLIPQIHYTMPHKRTNPKWQRTNLTSMTDVYQELDVKIDGKGDDLFKPVSTLRDAN